MAFCTVQVYSICQEPVVYFFTTHCSECFSGMPSAGWVLSLEVGEHIHDENASEAFIRNLHEHNLRGIVVLGCSSQILFFCSCTFHEIY